MLGRPISGFRRGPDRLEHVFVLIAVLAVVGLTYWRLYYGIDFTDESFYVAVPYRLVLGARPFIDETSVTQQTAALLVCPFIWAYRSTFGMTGIVLFLRHLDFVFSLAVATAVYAGLRPVLEGRRAALVALAAVAFVPFDIHGLSYNTLGSGLFTAGCLLGFRSLLMPSRRVGWLAGLCSGLAAFAYPPLLFPVAVAWAVRIVLSPAPARGRQIAVGVPALLLPIAGFAALIATAGFHQVATDFRRSSKYLGQGGGSGKLASIATHEWHTLPLWYLLIAALVTIGLTWRRQRALASVFVLALPVLVLPPKLTFYAASLEYVAHYGYLALPLFALVRGHSGARELFAAVWFPALLAGVTTAFSSANGGVNFAVGSFPAAIVSSAFLVWSLDLPTARRVRVPAGAAVAATIVILTLFEVIPVYRDGAVSTLDARVGQGPYAGLLTSRRKRAFLDRLERDLAGFGPACRISFFNDFPAGYLLTRARPDTNAVWVESVARQHVGSYQEILLGYFRRSGFPDVVVLMKRIPYAPPGSARIEHYSSREPLLVALGSRSYRTVISRLDYVVYRRASTRCGTHLPSKLHGGFIPG